MIQLCPKLVAFCLTLLVMGLGVLVTPNDIQKSTTLAYLDVQEASRYHWQPTDVILWAKLFGKDTQDAHSFVCRRPSVYVVPLIVGPLVLIGPARFRQNGNADILDHHPGLHLVQFGGGQSSGVPGEHTDPTMILVVLVALDQRRIGPRGLFGEIRNNRIFACFWENQLGHSSGHGTR